MNDNSYFRRPRAAPYAPRSPGRARPARGYGGYGRRPASGGYAPRSPWGARPVQPPRYRNAYGRSNGLSEYLGSRDFNDRDDWMSGGQSGGPRASYGTSRAIYSRRANYGGRRW